eukprot:TRINITY_DN6621_c1_g1_i1.p1 TRINITY_DN6621_c1_g1~~TRINITY_DN6621_c1_g1_i1.p1  ORF type:complete len:998 (+),score=306.06 TRINITY_DN6621_c1_g1_i1:65-2995(+)
MAAAGQRVFYYKPELSWVLGVCQGPGPRQRSGETVIVKGEDGSEVTVPAGPEHVHALSSELVLSENPRDLLDLSELYEGPLLHVIMRRYQSDVIYTFIGKMVLALNPFTYDIPHYKERCMEDYLTPGADAMARGSQLLPHTWCLGKAAYDDMRNNSANQTLLVSGESGAGKTETVKNLLRFLGKLSTARAGDPDGTSARLQSAILAASPILEAFGNAKTERNDNSSRFGKFLRLQFGANGSIVGAKTDIYLLEKSRVIMPSSGHGRVYHSFHQLLCSTAKSKYNLSDASCYPGASQSPKIPGVDDAADFEETNRAMTEAGITDEEREQVWGCVAGILHLQRLKFKPGPSDSSTIDPDTAPFLKHAADAFGIQDPAALETELLTTTTRMGRDMIKMNNKPQVAESARDSICKEVYTHLFSWLVTKINSKTDNPGCAHFIGLLDIFGFESFEYNGFEQLCINLANEMLQKHYNDHVFRADIAECKDEGIDVSQISYQDNQDTVDLLGAKRTGVLAALDDQCKTQPENDEGFLAKCVDRHADHRSFKKGPLDHGHFRVMHYAGEVKYTAAGMGVKNAEALKEGVVAVLAASQKPLVRQLVSNIDAGKKTASSKFREQLHELLAVINQTQPSWVRCIKPNPAKKPRMFDPPSVTEQLRCAGVLDTISIRKQGFPVRPPIQQFAGRYKCLLREQDIRGVDHATIARRVLEKLKVPPAQAQTGKTKLFLKHGVMQDLEEKRRMALMEHQLFLLRFCKVDQAARQAVGEACRRRWFLAFRMVEEAADKRKADLVSAEEKARKLAAEQHAQLRQAAAGRAAAPSIPAHVDPAALSVPALGGLDPAQLMQSYRPAPPPPAPVVPFGPHWKTYMLFARGPWPVYKKPRPGEHLFVDGKQFTLEPFTIVEAHDTSQDTGEPADTSDWLQLKGEGWVMRRGRQAHALETDDWKTHGWDPCPDTTLIPALAAPPALWENRDGHRVQAMD